RCDHGVLDRFHAEGGHPGSADDRLVADVPDRGGHGTPRRPGPGAAPRPRAVPLATPDARAHRASAPAQAPPPEVALQGRVRPRHPPRSREGTRGSRAPRSGAVPPSRALTRIRPPRARVAAWRSPTRSAGTRTW